MKYEEDLINEKEGGPKGQDDLKKENNPKKEDKDDHKNEDYPIMKIAQNMYKTDIEIDKNND